MVYTSERRYSLKKPRGFVKKQRKRADSQQNNEHARMLVSAFVVEHTAKRQHNADCQAKQVGADAENPAVFHIAEAPEHKHYNACSQQRAGYSEACGDHPAEIK